MARLSPGRQSRWKSVCGLLLLQVFVELACPARGLEVYPCVDVSTGGAANEFTGDEVSRLGGVRLGLGVAAERGCPSVDPREHSHESTAAAAAVDLTASGPGGAASGGAATDLSAAGGRRQLLATYPTSVTNGSASATFPAAAFAAWCAADAACAAAGSLTLSLLHYTDALPYTSVTLNWPNVFSGAGVSALQLVSGVVELQFGNYPDKRDALICGEAAANASCSAVISIPVSSSADLSQSFVCLRLEPSVTGSSFQAYGYPPGSSGLSVKATAVNGAMRCNTNRFGNHIILQYKQAALLPPPPSPPPSPPPPPPLNTVGAKYTYDVLLRVTLPLSVGFDVLKANETFLASLTASLESSLAAALDDMRTTLLFSSSTNILSSIYKISRLPKNTTAAVSVEFRVTVPAGATEGQMDAFVKLLASNATTLFSGSPYTSYFMSSYTVSYISSGSSSGLSTVAIVGIALGTMFGTLLLLLGGYAFYRWRAYAVILPKKPGGSWDKTGVAVVARKTARRRKVQRAGLDTPGGTDGGGADGRVPSAPMMSPPLPPDSPTAKGRDRAEEFPWERSEQAGAAGAGVGPGAGGPWVKSQARLFSHARTAWS